LRQNISRKNFSEQDFLRAPKGKLQGFMRGRDFPQPAFDAEKRNFSSDVLLICA
jgi:hypothetical protein